MLGPFRRSQGLANECCTNPLGRQLIHKTSLRMQQIAVAVRDNDLFLVATVARAAATDVYVNWPRDHVAGWKPHTSSHASGQHHHKSLGRAFGIQKKQLPDTTFKGTVNVVQFGVALGEHKALNLLCDPKDFSHIFEIPIAQVRPEMYKTFIYVDLVEPTIEPVLFPGGSIRQQEIYKEIEPWIILTFLEHP